MRTIRCFACVMFGVVSLGACGETETVREPVETLYVRGGGIITALQPGADRTAYSGRGTPSPNWSTVVRADSVVGGTEIDAADPSSGEDLWSKRVRGSVRPKIVSVDGDLVALGPASEAEYFHGRRSTRVMIMNRNEGTPTWLTLKGNYEPEAFSTDGSSLFVIRYLPALKPTRYQVRELDLASGEVGGVYTPHGELQQTMGGTARIQATSPDGKRLYTLYTSGRGETQYAFVHVLNLEQKWAHCIDLPAAFGRRAERASTLALSPNGETLFVVNVDTGALAAIDTSAFEVVAERESDLTPGAAHAASDGEKLYVASGPGVAAFDAVDLSPEWDINIFVNTRGLQVSAGRLYVGSPFSIMSLDPESGARGDVIEAPGSGKLKQLGPVVEFEEPPPEGPITCAC